MSIEAVIEYAQKDDSWGDLYAIYDYVLETGLEHELEALPTWYFERVEGGFIRPSFYIKYVNLTPMPYNAYMTWYQCAVQIQFFTEDVFEAGFVAGKLPELLAPPPHRELLLPKYDFTKSPPEKFSISGITADGNQVGSRVGLRIDPESITSRQDQEDDERWTTTVGFNFKTPRLTERDCNILRSITASRIGPPLEYPTLIAEVDMSSSAATEQPE